MPEVVLEPATGLNPPTQKERPWLFGLLVAPSAVLANGIVQGALSYLFRQQGVGIGRSSEIISLLILPTTIYFLWSPITDFWIERRAWLVTGAVAAGLIMAAAFHSPRLDTKAAVVLMFLSACCVQLVVASCGGMMGTLHGEAARRKASSFYQAGSLAFGAVAIFVMASLAQKISMGSLGWVAAALISLPAFAALATPKQTREPGQGIGHTLSTIWHEVKLTFFRWRALPYTLLMLFPMGSGAAIGLLPGIAQDYHVSGQNMAWMNGLAGALLTAAGSLSATLIPARISSSVAYLSVCLVNAATSAHPLALPTHPDHLPHRSHALPLHHRNLLRLVHLRCARVPRSLRQERQRTLLHHQLPRQRPGRLHDRHRRPRRQTLGSAWSGWHRRYPGSYRRHNSARILPHSQEPEPSGYRSARKYRLSCSSNRLSAVVATGKQCRLQRILKIIVLKGRGFSRAVSSIDLNAALAAEGISSTTRLFLFSYEKIPTPEAPPSPQNKSPAYHSYSR